MLLTFKSQKLLQINQVHPFAKIFLYFNIRIWSPTLNSGSLSFFSTKLIKVSTLKSDSFILIVLYVLLYLLTISSGSGHMLDSGFQSSVKSLSNINCVLNTFQLPLSYSHNFIDLLKNSLSWSTTGNSGNSNTFLSSNGITHAYLFLYVNNAQQKSNSCNVFASSMSAKPAPQILIQ